MSFALPAALGLALALPALAIAKDLRKGNWDYMTTAADEQSYYGQVLSRMGNQVVIKVLVTSPKDEVEKDYVLTYAIECKKMGIKQRGERKWEKIDQSSVAQSWWQWACK
tara:strand:+ start:573 stop:902 length:330 start_codon:yes stop_codon:yes gene_type:complete